jgi:prepilin-type N-terminal cleavage/methylation domain-containing protein
MMEKGIRNRKQGIRFNIFNRKSALPNTNHRLHTRSEVHLDRRISITSGFTLIELMIVIAILGILSGLFVTQYPAVQRRARDANRQSDIKQYQVAMELYFDRNNGSYLTSTGGSPYGQCGNLNLTNCPEDPKSPPTYRIESDSSQYVIWATLEQEDTSGNTQYFIVCSGGKVGTRITPPSTSTCPL